MAALDADWRHDSPDADLCALHGRTAGRHQQSARGSRALSLPRQSGHYFRLHGTIEPETIGQKVSSGCIRLFNHDIIDLYNRAPVGTRVVVLQEGESMRAEAGLETNGYYEPGPEPIGPYGGPPGPYAGLPGPYAGPYYEPPPWASGY